MSERAERSRPWPAAHAEERRPGPLRLGVLISGSGTNLQAIVDACAEGHVPAQVAVVVSNKEQAYGLVRAEKAGVPAVFIDPASFESLREYNDAILDALIEHEVDLVVMAGYMRLLGKQILGAFPDRVMNIHPTLLPAFPGASGIRDAFEYGVKVTGVTVHIADESFDAGPIVMQEAVVVAEEDTLQSLEAKIHEVEHRIYPEAIRLFAQGRLEFDGRKVHVLRTPVA